ncbi:MAG TPA: hypothetical protein VHF23_06250, partial [Gaiellaceae bacterium]|nr:hypothetical protein [Gaiellaceae bacterium]
RHGPTACRRPTSSPRRSASGSLFRRRCARPAQRRPWRPPSSRSPRLRTLPCEGGSYRLDAHRIVSADWFEEREVEFDERVAGRATLFDSSAAARITLDVTALVRSWNEVLAPNHGVLVRLAQWQEGYGVSGPAFPSGSFADGAARPRLVVTYALPAD